MVIEKPWLQIDQTCRVVLEQGENHTWKELEPANAYVAMIENFTRAVRDPKAGLHPAEDGLDQSLVIDALIRSARADGVPRPVEERK